MPIFERNGEKVLFIHIPKTGGTAIEEYFSSESTMTFLGMHPSPSLKICPQHFTVTDLKVLLGSDYWSMACAVIRDPYKRMESEFFFRTEDQFNKFGQRPDFSSWLIDRMNQVRRNPLFLDNHFRPQIEFIDSDITIFRFEEGLEIVIDEISRVLGINKITSLQHKNVSSKKDIKWSLDALHCVNQYYRSDFKEFGYPMKKLNLNFFVNRTK
ncbi:sulfotransferase family 2 domain-containing protein [Pseudomonadota bacterium]